MLRTRSVPCRASASASPVSSRVWRRSSPAHAAARQARRQRRHLVANEVDVGDDVRERVVDFVRHAGGERPDRRHPPREDELVLHPPPFGQIADEEVVPLGGRPRRIAIRDRHDRQTHVERGAVLAEPVDSRARPCPRRRACRPARSVGRTAPLSLPSCGRRSPRGVAGEAGERPVHGDTRPPYRPGRSPQRRLRAPRAARAPGPPGAPRRIRRPHRRHTGPRGRDLEVWHRRRISSAYSATKVTFSTLGTLPCVAMWADQRPGSVTRGARA